MSLVPVGHFWYKDAHCPASRSHMSVPAPNLYPICLQETLFSPSLKFSLALEPSLVLSVVQDTTARSGLAQFLLPMCPRLCHPSGRPTLPLLLSSDLSTFFPTAHSGQLSSWLPASLAQILVLCSQISQNKDTDKQKGRGMAGKRDRKRPDLDSSSGCNCDMSWKGFEKRWTCQQMERGVGGSVSLTGDWWRDGVGMGNILNF